MTDLETVIKYQLVLAKQIVKLYRNFKHEHDKNKTKGFFECKRNEIAEEWRSFKIQH